MKIPKSLKCCFRLLPTVAMLLTSLILLSYVSYSWIKRDWSSGINQQGITIATGNALAFVFSDDSSGGSVKDLKSLLGIEEFRLKSVSNATGKGGDFYSLTPSPQGEAYSTLNHLTWADLPSIGEQNDPTKINTELGVMYGYVDVMFAIQPPPNMAEDDTLLVYIDPSSYLRNTGDIDVISAIRISITLPPVNDPGITDGATYIFGSERRVHTGISTQDDYIMDGHYRFTESNGQLFSIPSITVNGDIKSMTEVYPWNGGYMYVLQDFDGSETFLCELNKGEVQYINVRIWAEGEDEACASEIAGESFDLLLKFSAKRASEINQPDSPPAE